MPKIGDKEAQRRALREAATKPRKEVVPNRSAQAAQPAPGLHNATPPATPLAPGAGLTAPKGQCAYCDRRRAYLAKAMKKSRKAKKLRS